MIAGAIAAKGPFSFVADSVMVPVRSKPCRARLAKAVSSVLLPVLHLWGKQQPVADPASAMGWADLELVDLDTSGYNEDLAGEWTRGLLVRRNITDCALALFLHM